LLRISSRTAASSSRSACPIFGACRRASGYVVFDGSETHWGIDEYDVANQGLISHHFDVRDGQVTMSSGPFRYVWPAELDLMAELAGMGLRERWSGWKREPFTSESRGHVSVWQKIERRP
jgi:hypothetical protein